MWLSKYYSPVKWRSACIGLNAILAFLAPAFLQKLWSVLVVCKGLITRTYLYTLSKHFSPAILPDCHLSAPGETSYILYNIYAQNALCYLCTIPITLSIIILCMACGKGFASILVHNGFLLQFEWKLLTLVFLNQRVLSFLLKHHSKQAHYKRNAQDLFRFGRVTECNLSTTQAFPEGRNSDAHLKSRWLSITCQIFMNAETVGSGD